MNTKNLLIIGAVVIVGVLALWGLLGSKSSYSPYPTTSVTEENLNAALNELDSTDLNNADSDLNRIDSDSSLF